MKKIFVLLAACTLAVGCGSSVERAPMDMGKTDRETMLLKGDVKSVTSTTYDIDAVNDTDTILVFVSKNITIYDQKGNATENSFYDESGKQTSSLKKTYDKNNFLSSTSSYFDGKQTAATEYKNNKYGDILEQTEYDQDGNITAAVKYTRDEQGRETLRAITSSVTDINYEYGTIYNDKGLVIEDNFWNKDSGEKFRKLYTYDDLGHIFTTEEIYDMFPENNSTSTYRTDLKGNILEKNTMNADGKTSFSDVYHYDQNDNVTIHLAKERGLLMYRDESEYDSLSRVTNYYNYEVAINGKAILQTVNFYRYNEDGQQYVWGAADSDGKIFEKWEATYQNDAKGNFVKKITTFGDDKQLNYIEQRVIEYYN